MRLPYLFAALCLFNTIAGSAVSIKPRGINDVFPGFDYPLTGEEHHAEEHSPERDTSPTHISNKPTAINPLISSGATSNSAVKSRESSTQSHFQSTLGNVRDAPATYSVIGTVPPLPSVTPWSATAVSATAANPAGASPTAAVSPVSSEDKGPPRSMQEWKIIGVAVIAFTTVAAILLLSVFFDHWWGFIRDLCWRNKRKDNTEELVPDWQRASWAINLGRDRHRYPSMPPMASTKQAELGLDRSTENVAGIGSGMKGDMYSNLTPRTEHQLDSPWTRGLGLSPLPPVAQPNYHSPPGLLGHSLARHPSKHHDSNRNPPSPALTDPYGGIAE